MLSCTLQEYKTSFKLNLSTYLNEHVDYTYTSFLEMEIERYTAYSDELFKILNKLEIYDEAELKKTFLDRSLFRDLIGLNVRAYDGFVVEEKQHFEYDEQYRPNSIFPIVIIDLKKLKNYFKSSKLILEFISNKEQSAVPGEEIVVDAGDNVSPKKSEVVVQCESNNFEKSTIEDCLHGIINNINSSDYKILVDALYSYFTTGNFPKLKSKIVFKSVNKKKVGWALKEVFKNLESTPLKFDYFEFAQRNINLFENEEVDKEKFRTSRIYKYFTTKI